jgi:hypothetical protein
MGNAQKEAEYSLDLIHHFLTNSGMIGEDELLNDYSYPEKAFFTAESWAAAPRFGHEGWYRRENGGANPGAMAHAFVILELLNISIENDDNKFVAMAEKLADHMIKYQITDKKRAVYGGFGKAELVNDSAHQLPMALLWLYSRNNKDKYRDAALICLDNFVLNHHFQRDTNGALTGVFYDYYSEERNRFESWGADFKCAHSPLCFAFSLFAAYEFTGNLEYLEAVSKAYDWLIHSFNGKCLASHNGIEIHSNNSRETIKMSHKQVVPRYAGYIIHTLLGTWHYTKEKRYLDEAVRCGDLIIAGQRTDGSFPLSLELEQYYPGAQNGAFGYLLGPLHLLYLASGKKRFEESASKAVFALSRDQVRNPSITKQYGGILRKGGTSVLEGVFRHFGYGFVTDTFQAALTCQGLNIFLEKYAYIGMPDSDFLETLKKN